MLFFQKRIGPDSNESLDEIETSHPFILKAGVESGELFLMDTAESIIIMAAFSANGSKRIILG